MIFLVALCLVTTSFALPDNAQAGDFTRTGLGDIIDMWRTSDGNIRAMDINGNVAEFDYSKWTRIHNGALDGFQFLMCSRGGGLIFDPVTNTYLLYKPTEYKILYRDTFLTKPISGVSNVKGMFFGHLVSATPDANDPETLIVKYHDLDGNLSVSIPFKPGSGTPDLVNVNPMTGNMLFQYLPPGAYSDRYYKVTSFDLTEVSDATKERSGMYNSVVDQTYYLYVYAEGETQSTRWTYAHRRSHVDGSSGGRLTPGLTRDVSVTTPFYSREGLMASFENYNTYLNGRLYDTRNSASPLISTAAIRDKYGNLMLGGQRGRVLVINANTEYITDNVYYLAYIASDASKYAKEARDASLLAQEFAQSAESKASEVVDQLKGLTPTIVSVQATNAATATKNNTINLTVNATNASEYRIGKEGVFKNWQSSPELVTPLLSYGANTLIIEAKRVPDGGVTRSTITIFKIQ